MGTFDPRTIPLASYIVAGKWQDNVLVLTPYLRVITAAKTDHKPNYTYIHVYHTHPPRRETMFAPIACGWAESVGSASCDMLCIVQNEQLVYFAERK